MEEHRLALAPGYQFDQFRIEATLGKGGFGITYLALDLHLDKQVALKELLPDSIATRIDGSTVMPHSASLEESWLWARERFLAEAKTLAGFSHPAIVGVHRLIEANGTVYMVMDYVEGETYEAQLRRTGPVRDQATLLAVVGPLLSGLAEVHRKGLIHRDIKPDNILINRHGNPILIDFGSARSAVGATMTMTSIVTHGYSPIEQYQTKGKMGPWTDIYALGAVACRAITGEKPQVAADRIAEDESHWVSHRELTGFSKECLAAIDWALRVRLEDRPQRMEDWEPSLRVGLRGNVQARQQAPSELPTESVSADWPESSTSETSPLKATIAQPKIAQTIPSKCNKPKSNRILIGIVIAIVLLGAITGAVMMHQAEKEKATIQEVVKRSDNAELALFVVGKMEQIKQFAVDGDRSAQFLMGEIYYFGWGVVKDGAEAVQWYRKAADQGYAMAQISLGSNYFNGNGVAKDEAEAVKWDRKAAEQNYAMAQYNLGWSYANGRGVVKDETEAVKWYRKAAEQNYAMAQINLGLSYANGRGVVKDEAEAVKWYRKAADQEYASGQYNLGWMYANGQGVAKDEAEAVKLYRKAADQGHASGQCNLGAMYANGQGVAKDETEAVKWFRRAADQGNKTAIEELKRRGLR